MKRSLICASLLTCSLALAGCAVQPGQENASAQNESGEKCCTAPAKASATGLSPAGTVNMYCVVNPNDTIEADSPTAEWKGEKIGFCCPGCVKKWGNMTAEQKDAKVAAGKAKNLVK